MDVFALGVLDTHCLQQGWVALAKGCQGVPVETLAQLRGAGAALEGAGASPLAPADTWKVGGRVHAEIRLMPSSLRRGHRGCAAVREGYGGAGEPLPQKLFLAAVCFPSLAVWLRRGRSGAENTVWSFFIF